MEDELPDTVSEGEAVRGQIQDVLQGYLLHTGTELCCVGIHQQW